MELKQATVAAITQAVANGISLAVLLFAFEGVAPDDLTRFIPTAYGFLISVIAPFELLSFLGTGGIIVACSSKFDARSLTAKYGIFQFADFFLRHWNTTVRSIITGWPIVLYDVFRPLLAVISLVAYLGTITTLHTTLLLLSLCSTLFQNAPSNFKASMATACVILLVWMMKRLRLSGATQDLYESLRPLGEIIYAFYFPKIFWFGALLVSLWNRGYMIALFLAKLTASKEEVSTSTFQYKYAPLQTTKHLRILKLMRTHVESAIMCELLHTTLEDHVAYEAISYTWDDPAITHEIIIDRCRFGTSAKVYKLLRAQQSPWRAKYIWIDFICINQDDPVEKKGQIEIMRQIYQEAANVTVWLGESDDCRTARDALTEIANAILYFNVNNEEMFKNEAQASERHKWVALARLFHNRWFRRVWIIQEAVSASKLTVIYGTETISWGSMVFVMNYCSAPELLELLQGCQDYETMDWDQEGISNVQIIFALKQLFGQGERWALGQVLEACRGFDSTEPKDKVFALLGITSDGENPELGLDYNSDVRQTFRNVTKYLLTSKSVLPGFDPLFPLSHAGIGLSRRLTNLPSWVADWSGNKGRYQVEAISAISGDSRYQASLDTRPDLKIEPDSSGMQARGFLVDEITDLCSLWDAPSQAQNDARIHNDQNISRAQSVSQLSEWYQEIQVKVNESARNPYHTGQPLDEVIARTLIGDASREAPRVRPAPQIYLDAYLIWKRNREVVSGFFESNPADVALAAIPLIHEFNLRQTTGESLYEFAWDMSREFKPDMPVLALEERPTSEDGWRDLLLASLESDDDEVNGTTRKWIGIIDQIKGRATEEAAVGYVPKVSAERQSLPADSFLSNLYNAATRFSYGRRFCLTKNGYVGLAPALTEVGDKVFIILGGCTPYLLRQKPDQPSEGAAHPEFELVGDCYLHGVMDGEMMDKINDADWIHLV